jgi:hypothetical protein
MLLSEAKPIIMKMRNMSDYRRPVWMWELLLLLYSPLLGLGHFLSFLILYTVGRTAWKGDQPVVRPLPTHKTTVGFEPTIPGPERAKTVRALERATTVIG